MSLIKKILIALLGKKRYYQLRGSNITQVLSLIKNYYIDALLFYKHSSVFKKNTINKKESLIILGYHSLEKGLLHDPIRYRFGMEYVKKLIQTLNGKDVAMILDRSQIAATFLVLCTYYEKHKESNVDISDYFPDSTYKDFKNYSSLKLTSVINHNIDEYFGSSNSDFSHFSYSRCSVRDFTGDSIALETIYKVIELAGNAPSVCNRQPVKVYYLNVKEKINEIFKLQGGLKGYDEKIVQLLIVVSDRNYFYTIGERNQMYIDGGIFLMNLLYALHFYKIGACPAHWGMDVYKDLKINTILNLSESEKVISLVPIGIPINNFKTTLSLRRTPEEIFRIIQ